MEVYVNQGFLAITLDTGVVITTATNTKIIALSPSGQSIELDATVVESTKLRHEFADDEITQAGTWSFQAKFTVDDRTALGQIVKQVFKQKL